MHLTARANAYARGGRRSVLATSMLVIATTLGLNIATTAAASKTPYNTNLLKNPGFEAGPASPSGYTKVRIPGWHRDGNATVVRYGTDGFPTTAEGRRISGGHKFFASGPPDEFGCGAVTQVLALKGRNSAIDSGQLSVNYRGRLGTYVGQPDTAHAEVTFFDSEGEQLPGFDYTSSGTDGTMVPFSVGISVPSGARGLALALYASDTVGYCDAYGDNFSLKLIKN